MEAYERPIRELAEHVRAFVARPRGRLLHVGTDGLMHDAVIELALGFEYHADNRSPFVLLSAPSTGEDRGWGAREEALRASHAARREAMAEAGYALPALGARSEAEDAVSRFAAATAQTLRARCEPLSGLVLILAPGHVADPASFDRDLGWLMAAPELRGARWIVVEVGPCSITEALAERAGALHAQAVVDEEEACRELEERLDAAAASSMAAAGPAQVGAAWPRGVLPPGADGGLAADPVRASLAAVWLGLPAGVLGGALREMRTLVLRGALAARRGDPLEAARHQGHAARACASAGLGREACLMELVLGSYLLQAGERALAEERYRAAGERARERGWADLAAQALMAVGAIRLLERDRSGASIAYGWAGRAARDGGEDGLAIEGFRMAGQVAAEDGGLEIAGKLLSEACAIAEGMSEADAGRTSAPIAARQLAAHYARGGMDERASALRAQADRMDAAARADETAA